MNKEGCTMEEKEIKQQDNTKIVTKTIDYIDDMGNKHRMYTDNKDVEDYIKRNYVIIENNPQENLTS
jgi:hypothetical protein